MSSHTLLATITEMEARLGEMRQQLVQSMYLPQQGVSYPLFQSQSQSQQQRSYPPGFAPRSTRGRVPYTVASPPATAIPLQSHRPYSTPFSSHASHASHVARPVHPSGPSFHTVPLSAILQPQEEVLFRILLRKGSQEEKADLVTVFDGEKLVVTVCELIPALVGTSVVKPGEILYRFMEELHTAGHLKRTFTVAPWKLCSVVRDGVAVSLEELRRQHLARA